MNTELFLCDECDCLASVSVQGDTILLQTCQCVTLDWSE